MAITNNDEQVMASLMFWLYVTTKPSMYAYDAVHKTLTPTTWDPANPPANVQALFSAGTTGTIQGLLNAIAQDKNDWATLIAAQTLFQELMTNTTIFPGNTTPYIPTQGETCPHYVESLTKLILSYPAEVPPPAPAESSSSPSE